MTAEGWVKALLFGRIMQVSRSIGLLVNQTPKCVHCVQLDWQCRVTVSIGVGQTTQGNQWLVVQVGVVQLVS